MNHMEVAGRLKREFQARGFRPGRWTVDNEGIIEVYFQGGGSEKFRIGPNNRWEWFDEQEQWIGYTSFKGPLQ